MVDRSDMAKIYNSLKTEERIKTFELLVKGDNLSDIADRLEMSYSGVYAYLEDFEEAGLVKNLNGKREVTDKGQTVVAEHVNLVRGLQHLAVEERRHQIKSAAEDLEAAGIPTPFSEGDWEDVKGPIDDGFYGESENWFDAFESKLSRAGQGEFLYEKDSDSDSIL